MKNKNTSRQDVYDAHLHKKTKKEYGTAFRDHYLEQYKILISGVDYTSKGKHTVNRYYLTINTILLAAIGLSVTREQIATTTITHQLVPIMGLCMSVSWWFTVRSYNKILEVKFGILHRIEENLPMALYRTEWELIKESHNPRRATFIDAAVPLLFFAFYVIVLYFVR